MGKSWNDPTDNPGAVTRPVTDWPWASPHDTFPCITFITELLFIKLTQDAAVYPKCPSDSCIFTQWPAFSRFSALLKDRELTPWGCNRIAPHAEQLYQPAAALI